MTEAMRKAIDRIAEAAAALADASINATTFNSTISSYRKVTEAWQYAEHLNHAERLRDQYLTKGNS